MTFTVTRQRAQEVHDRARARAGLGYDFGGAFTNDPRDSTDCSGLVLQTAAWYGGRTDWVGNRYGSTESFRLDHKIVYDLGFKRMPPGGPATLPFKPVMLVGLMHGGGGEYSHTACTLMTMDIPGGPVKMSDRGVDWESHGDVNGVGVSLYDGARPWNDSLFHDFWYLDAQLEGGNSQPRVDSSAVDVLARAMAPTGVGTDRLGALLPAVSQCLQDCGCTTVDRIAMWCAQIGHESAGLRYMEEIASGAAYEGRTDLGNYYEGDGVRFKGRGPIQVTGRRNYTVLSRWAFDKGLVPSPTFFVDQPAQLASDRYGFVGVTWYWTTQRPMNDAADARDIVRATQYVNGGQTGIDDRRWRYQHALDMGDQLLTLTAPAEPVDPFEEILMLSAPSMSIYANPGEPPVPVVDMIRALDAHGPHEPYVEAQARAGDPDALFRVVRTAAGKGQYGTAAGPVNQARAVLADIEKTNSALLQAFKAQNGIK